MTPTELKEFFVAYSKTLDDKDEDEFYGTAQDDWNNVYPKFLMWYNSKYNKLKSKELKNQKKINDYFKHI
jgi:hypothetical protein